MTSPAGIITHDMSVCIISFSSRKNGNCGQIAAYLLSLHKDAGLYDFADFSIHPCGGCAYECFDRAGQCPFMGDREYELYEAILRSARTYYIMPNYCDYPCANFFIFNERSQCFFQGHPGRLEAYCRIPKKFIVVSNTNERNFREILAYHVEGEPEILFLSARKYGRVSIAGDLMTSGEAAARIGAFAGEDILDSKKAGIWVQQEEILDQKRHV